MSKLGSSFKSDKLRTISKMTFPLQTDESFEVSTDRKPGSETALYCKNAERKTEVAMGLGSTYYLFQES